jgi:hypothetical protein
MGIPASKAGIMPAISLLRNKNMGVQHRSMRYAHTKPPPEGGGSESFGRSHVDQYA